jgi:tetratricopeptide (TPR) repeat protein
MQAGDLPKDAAFIDQIFQQRKAEAEDAAKKSDAIAQLGAYRSLVSDFSGLKEVGESEKKLSELKKSAALKAALKDEQVQIVEQSNLEQDISSKMKPYLDGAADDSIALHTEILQSMRRLADDAAHAKKESKRLLAHRVFDDLWVAWIETGQRELEARHFAKAESCFQLMGEVRADPWPVLLLAETHAAAGNRKLALKDLREAVKRGLHDAEAIESNPALQSLKTEPEFDKIIAELKHN